APCCARIHTDDGTAAPRYDGRQQPYLGEIMIGPPGLPKFGRRIFSPVASTAMDVRGHGWRWFAGLYLAGVLAHFSHHLAFDLPADRIDPSLGIAISSMPTSLAWPADLIQTLIDLS